MQSSSGIFPFLSKNAFRMVMGLLLIICGWFAWNNKWQKDNFTGNLVSDGPGYYAFLPAVFIYHDLQFGFVDAYETKYYGHAKPGFLKDIDGRKLDKYFIGESMLMMPFFFTACALTALTGNEMDGYSYFFQVMAGLSGIIYAFLGLYFLRRLLRFYAGEWVALVVTVSVFTGTNLLYYTLVEPTMSHAYSFFAFSAFLYFAKKSMVSYSASAVRWMCFFFALIVLIRPSNGMILLALPFLAGSRGILSAWIRRVMGDGRNLLACLCILLPLLFLQPLFYYLQTGHWFVYAYTDERFYFSRPEIMNVLFSYRRGLFVYTPLAFLSLFGLIPLFRKSRFSGLSIVLLLALVVWVISSWWSWYYGGSFGHRAFIEYLTLFMVLLAVLIQSAPRLLRFFLVAGCAFCILLNVVQTWQAFHVIIPWDGMTKSRYWVLFFNTDMRNSWRFVSGSFHPEEGRTEKEVIFTNDMDPGYGWLNERTMKREKAHSGEFASRMDEENKRSITFSDPVLEIFSHPDTTCVLEAELWALPETSTDAEMIISFEKNDTVIKRVVRPLGQPGIWNKVTAAATFPDDPSNYTVMVYAEHKGSEIIYVDDFRLRFSRK